MSLVLNLIMSGSLLLQNFCGCSLHPHAGGSDQAWMRFWSADGEVSLPALGTIEPGVAARQIGNSCCCHDHCAGRTADLASDEPGENSGPRDHAPVHCDGACHAYLLLTDSCSNSSSGRSVDTASCLDLPSGTTSRLMAAIYRENSRFASLSESCPTERMTVLRI
ncbi:MAG: hypothetical protein ACK526_21870 [Planctomyces sp.]